MGRKDAIRIGAAWWIALLLASTTGCRGTGAQETPAPETPPTETTRLEATPCRDPRPEICTREYIPVCAERDNGIRCVTTPCDSTDPHTYGNACSACADPKVISHVPGRCPDAEPSAPDTP